ncbi:MAG: hypothetical protein M1587_09805 [Thaumarchaeota archaeon]|nr:hypothetical protein [Nitrososphaerota archaeon]
MNILGARWNRRKFLTNEIQREDGNPGFHAEVGGIGVHQDAHNVQVIPVVFTIERLSPPPGEE